MRRTAPAALPPGLSQPGARAGSGGGISGKVRSIKAKVERHVLWILKAGLALICGAATAAAVGTWVQAAIYWPLWVIVWAIGWVVVLFGGPPFSVDPVVVVLLAVAFWLMVGWAIVGTGWDWECDRLEQACLLLMCCVAIGAGGTIGESAGWMAERGHDLGQLTLGKLLGG